MEMSGEYRIAAPRETVWRALNDPEILQRSIPGCESIEKQSDTDMTAKATIQVGPVKARFSGKVKLLNLDPPNGYTISGEGQGGVAGFAKGGADVALSDDGAGGTILKYTAKATVGGKLAQLGARLIDATAAKMAGEFFSRFAAAVAPPAPEMPAAASAAEVPAPSVPPAPAVAPRPALPSWMWVSGLVVIAAVVLWYVSR